MKKMNEQPPQNRLVNGYSYVRRCKDRLGLHNNTQTCLKFPDREMCRSEKVEHLGTEPCKIKLTRCHWTSMSLACCWFGDPPVRVLCMGLLRGLPQISSPYNVFVVGSMCSRRQPVRGRFTLLSFLLPLFCFFFFPFIIFALLFSLLLLLIVVPQIQGHMAGSLPFPRHDGSCLFFTARRPPPVLSLVDSCRILHTVQRDCGYGSYSVASRL